MPSIIHNMASTQRPALESQARSETTWARPAPWVSSRRAVRAVFYNLAGSLFFNTSAVNLSTLCQAGLRPGVFCVPSMFNNFGCENPLRSLMEGEANLEMLTAQYSRAAGEGTRDEEGVGSVTR